MWSIQIVILGKDQGKEVCRVDLEAEIEEIQLKLYSICQPLDLQLFQSLVHGKISYTTQ
jgi:hypothetical protein